MVATGAMTLLVAFLHLAGVLCYLWEGARKPTVEE